MGYKRSDNRYGGGDERWRDRGQEGRYEERSRYGGQRDFERSPGDDDRDLFDRAGDEVRSWFGDDDAERWRDRDQRRFEREQGMSGREGARSAAMMGAAGGRGMMGRGRDHDPHYSEWRQRQIEELDRDYDEYRREHQSRFDQEFAGWREKRQGQRQSLRKATEHMEVIGSDGQHVGTVDAMKGDRIILTRNDENAGGHHHSIPCSWIESVDERVTINKTAEQAMQAWRDEEHNRALFEREDSGSDGPHVLNRSFSGTY